MHPPRCSFLSPALPDELLTHILNQNNRHTTLIVCSSRADFLASLLQNIQHRECGQETEEEQGIYSRKHRLLTSPIHQVAISRHIRTVYIPTVTHLRAYLSVFSVPPSDKTFDPRRPGVPTSRPWEQQPGVQHDYNQQQEGKPHHRRLLVYGFLDLHYDTSEWSAQGIGTSVAALVDLADRLRWPVAIVEPRQQQRPPSPVDGTRRGRHNIRGVPPVGDEQDEEQQDYDDDDEMEGGKREQEEEQRQEFEVGERMDGDNYGNEDDDEQQQHQNDHDHDHKDEEENEANSKEEDEQEKKTPLESLLQQTMPILSCGASVRRRLLRFDGAHEDSGWSGRTVQVGAVMGRWFRFREWDPSSDNDERLDF